MKISLSLVIIVIQWGGGIRVAQAGKLTLLDGIISNNTATEGGGLMVWSSNNLLPTFIQNGGIIKNNTAKTGGGVYKPNGTYTRNSGIVCGNRPSNSYETHSTCPTS